MTFRYMRPGVLRGRSQGIQCLDCGATSWNANDVAQCFCARCNKFHPPFPYESQAHCPQLPTAEGVLRFDEETDVLRTLGGLYDRRVQTRLHRDFTLRIPVEDAPPSWASYHRSGAALPAVTLELLDHEDTVWLGTVREWAYDVVNRGYELAGPLVRYVPPTPAEPVKPPSLLKPKRTLDL